MSTTKSKHTRNLAGHIIGYARVSTADQDATMQREALNAAGAARVFEDVAS
ncbi:recombinase family protein, partial [Burkholderia sp. 4M9327G5]